MHMHTNELTQTSMRTPTQSQRQCPCKEERKACAHVWAQAHTDQLTCPQAHTYADHQVCWTANMPSSSAPAMPPSLPRLWPLPLPLLVRPARQQAVKVGRAWLACKHKGGRMLAQRTSWRYRHFGKHWGGPEVPSPFLLKVCEGARSCIFSDERFGPFTHPGLVSEVANMLGWRNLMPSLTCFLFPHTSYKLHFFCKNTVCGGLLPKGHEIRLSLPLFCLFTVGQLPQ